MVKAAKFESKRKCNITPDVTCCAVPTSSRRSSLSDNAEGLNCTLHSMPRPGFSSKHRWTDNIETWLPLRRARHETEIATLLTVRGVPESLCRSHGT